MWHDGSAFTWTNGKQLTSATAADGTVLSYSYDADGLRLTKVVDGVTHNYLWQGDRLVSEQYGTTELEFFYDESGVPYALDYDGTIYYYITNLQGDVIGIVDASGVSKATYKYNAWGEDIDTTGVVSDIETINPLRYRGYYYDSETKLYYLQSRYYDPVVCRFINADDFTATGQGFLGYNTYAYCANNPVTRADAGGVFWDTVFDVVSLVVSVTQVIENPKSGEAWASLAADVVCLAVPGLTGGGAIVKAVTKVDDVVDAARTVENLSDAARAVDNLSDSSKALKTADNLDVGALCFVAGTIVLTEYGDCPIEDVEVADLVWAWDEETGRIELKEVVDTYLSYTDELIHIIVNGVEIVTTPNHPFYTTCRGWVIASEILETDTLYTADGNIEKVDEVWLEELSYPTEVYNLHIDEFHTYFVSGVGILVHNSCIQQSPLPRNGMTMSTDDALDLADKFLGPGYTEPSPNRFVSADGMRQVRMGPDDLAGLHANGPHINFDLLLPKHKGVHIYFID